MFAHMLTFAIDRTYTDPFLDHIDCINGIAHLVDVRVVQESNLIWSHIHSRSDIAWVFRHIQPLITQRDALTRQDVVKAGHTTRAHP